MPAKNHTSRSREDIEAAVKRYYDGESVAVLSKYYGVSRPCVYLWIKKVEKDLLAKDARAGMSPAAIRDADRRELQRQLDAEKAENRKLKRLCCELMIKTGDYSMLTES